MQTSVLRVCIAITTISNALSTPQFKLLLILTRVKIRLRPCRYLMFKRINTLMAVIGLNTHAHLISIPRSDINFIRQPNEHGMWYVVYGAHPPESENAKSRWGGKGCSQSKFCPHALVYRMYMYPMHTCHITYI